MNDQKWCTMPKQKSIIQLAAEKIRQQTNDLDESDVILIIEYDIVIKLDESNNHMALLFSVENLKHSLMTKEEVLNSFRKCELKKVGNLL